VLIFHGYSAIAEPTTNLKQYISNVPMISNSISTPISIHSMMELSKSIWEKAKDHSRRGAGKKL
jgi:hypothetical protein